MKLVREPESITHFHLLSVIATETIRRKLDTLAKVRILDAGCGNGHLITFLHVNLSALFPQTSFEIYGYDVADHNVQTCDFFSSALAWCREQCPGVVWENHLKLIAQDDAWPFADSMFDVVISNQVLEHVWNHNYFFTENYRVLKEKGYGIHLFPLKHYIYEGHLLLPFVHRIADWHVLKAYIHIMSRLGFGKYNQTQFGSLEDFAERHADYMTFCTNYLSYRELFSLVRRNRFRPSLKYTADFYQNKVRQLLRKETKIILGSHEIPVATTLINLVLKYISAVTLFIEKDNTYISL